MGKSFELRGRALLISLALAILVSSFPTSRARAGCKSGVFSSLTALGVILGIGSVGFGAAGVYRPERGLDFGIPALLAGGLAVFDGATDWYECGDVVGKVKVVFGVAGIGLAIASIALRSSNTDGPRQKLVRSIGIAIRF